MKIILLLVLKCLLYSKITGDRIYKSDIRGVCPAKIEHQRNDLEECSKQRCFRVKRESPVYEGSIFEPAELVRSPRRKRAEIHKQNKIFFRRRKKKMVRKSRIRKSLMKRGKFTTPAPYRRNLKKYMPGRGKVARPAGLKYRKRYRFNTFKKTQDVALGIGAEGRAQFHKSPPKKRPPIHVRDYKKRRGTRKALRGRGGERRQPPDADRRRAGTKDDRRKGPKGNRVQNKKSKEYYDDFSDYSEQLDEDSLPKQTKSKKSYNTVGKTTKRKKATKSLKIKDSDYAYSSEDNTLLLSDEEQLTDISSEIEELRSELSDEKSKHHKNASSSEYEQYNYADDDSAIVTGEVASSEDDSPEKHVTYSKKTTLLGPVNYEQYDIKKLDASMKRVFKKSKKQNQANLQYDDPLEYLEDAYKDETSYEASPDTERGKQKDQKSKSKLKKGSEKSKPKSNKDQQLKAKSAKAQTEANPETDMEESYSYDESEEYNDESNPEKDQSEGKLGEDEEPNSNEESEEYYSDDEYSSDEYSSYTETIAPKRRIPTWKFSKHSTQDTFYEEYTDANDDNMSSGLDSKSKPELKKTKTSIPESEEYGSKHYYSESDSSPHVVNKKQNKIDKISNKLSKIKTAKLKSDFKQNQETLEYDSEDLDRNTKSTIKLKKLTSKKDSETSTYDSEDYNSEEYSLGTSVKQHSSKNLAKKDLLKSTKKSKMSTSKKAPSEKSMYESEEYYSEEYSDSDSDNITKTEDSFKSTKKSKILQTSKKLHSKKDFEISTSESQGYDSEEYSDSSISIKSNIETKDLLKFSTNAKSKKSSSKKMYPKKDLETSTYKSSEEYYSEYSDENDEKTNVKTNKTPKQLQKMPMTKRATPSKKITAKKKSKSEKKQPTSTYKSDYSSDYSDQNKEEGSILLESFGMDELKRETTFKLSPSAEIEIRNAKLKMMKSEKSQKVTSPKILNSKHNGFDIVHAKHDQKYNLSSNYTETSEHKLNQDGSDHSHDIYESHKVTPSKKTINEKSFKKNPTFDKGANKITKKSPIKTTKTKYTKKSLETSYEEADYDSQVTSYEYSSDDASFSEKSHSKSIIKKKTICKGHETSIKKSQDLNIEDNLEDTSSNTCDGKTKSTKTSKGKTTLTSKRHKKGFTTLASTKIKGFDSKEALQNISSKAAAITKKHAFIYNTKKKAYELVRIDSSKSQGKKGLSAAYSQTKTIQNSPSPTPHSETITHLTSPQTLDHTILKYSITNKTKTQNVLGKTLRKRIVCKKSSLEEVHDDILHSKSSKLVAKEPTKKVTPDMELPTKKKTKHRIKRATPYYMYKSDKSDEDEYKDFGLDDSRNKRERSPSAEIEMKKEQFEILQSVKSEKLQAVERLNPHPFGFNVVQEEHAQKYTLASEYLEESEHDDTSEHESESNHLNSDSSHDTASESPEFKSFGGPDSEE